MRKSNSFAFMFLVTASIMVMVFSACSLFRDPAQNGSVLTGQNATNFIKSIRTYKGNAELYYNAGCHFQERKKHKLAITEFYKAIECDPEYFSAYNGMGISYDALGDYVLAINSYNKALKIDSNRDDVLNNLGYSYLLQGRPDLAIESFKKAISLNGNNNLYHNNLGLAYAKTGQFDAAYVEFKKSGDEAKAHYNIAKLYYQKGHYKEAKEHFAAVNSFEPQTKRAVKASESLEKILAVEEKSPEKTVETVSNTPAVEIIYTDDRISFIPSGAPENISYEEENIQERKDEYFSGLTVVDVNKSDDDVISTIPDDALKQSESAEIIGSVITTAGRNIHDKEVEVKLVTASMVQAESQQKPEKILEEKGLVIFNEDYAPQMLKLEKTISGRRPEPRIKIEVKNGNGVNRMARRVGDYLRNSDFVLMYLSNADHFDHKYSKIYFVSGYLSEAYQLAQKLPGLQTLEEVTSIKDGNAEISILIGTDLVPYDAQFKRG